MKIIINKISPETSEQQIVFVKGKRTTKSVFSLPMIAERSPDLQKDIFNLMVYYEKAFDTVRHEDLLDIHSEEAEARQKRPVDERELIIEPTSSRQAC